MAKASTKIPAVRLAIKGVLETTPLLEEQEVKVSNGKMPERERRFAWIMKAKSRRKWKTIGPAVTPQEETIEVMLMFWVQAGKDSEETEARAIEVFEAAETALREDASLGELVLMQQIEDLEIEGALLDKAHGCRILAKVVCKARI